MQAKYLACVKCQLKPQPLGRLGNGQLPPIGNLKALLSY